jgi:Na+/phosphate symporter
METSTLQQAKDELELFIQEHSEELLHAADGIEAIINNAMKHYDDRQSEIIQSVIHDPADINDPEQHVRDLLAIEQQKISDETAEKLKEYKETLEKQLEIKE